MVIVFEVEFILMSSSPESASFSGILPVVSVPLPLLAMVARLW